jgi:O-antigen/teichoic acid export membrane protein
VRLIHWVRSDGVRVLSKWGIKGGIAVLDQGLFSGANFVLNILLARWLGPVGYGTFSLVFAVYLFLSGFHNAIILEPMSVLGTGKYFDRLEDYLSSQFVIHAILCGALSILVVIAGTLFFVKQVDNQFSIAMLGMGVFLPFMLLMWLARRLCYVYGKPSWAFYASGVYAVVLLGSLFFVKNIGQSSNIFLIFVIMGFAGLVGSGVVYRLIHFSHKSIFNIHLAWNLFIEQWFFGRWIMLAALFNFAGTQIQLFMIASLLGLYAAGVLSALQNIILPMMQIATVISTMGLPSVAFEFGQQKYGEIKRKSFKISTALVLLSVANLGLITLIAVPLERLFYAGKFAEYVWLLPIIGLIPVLTSIETGYSLIIRSLRRPSYHAIRTGFMAVTGVSSGWLLILNFKVAGAAFSLLFVAAVSLFVNIWFYRSWFLANYSDTAKDSE